jgi:hypothetical protein
MIVSYALERLIERETFRQIVALLEPEELIVAVLRLEGLSDVQIGDMLGVSGAAVNSRMQTARARIMAQAPDLTPTLRDRRQPARRPPSNEPPPLEHGWLCCWVGETDVPFAEGKPDLTTADVARSYRVTPQTVTRWLRAGVFPNAYRLEGEEGDYRIPGRDLVGFEPWGWG